MIWYYPSLWRSRLLQLTDVLKAKKVRPMGLDWIREHHVFETLNEVIGQIHRTDMHERAVLLQRIETELKATASTWNILSNSASMFGVAKSLDSTESVQQLKTEIETLRMKKQTLAKARVAANHRYDDMMAATKSEVIAIQNECQTVLQLHQQQLASNSQILQDMKRELQR